MWSWNTSQRMRVSQLYGNLVILFYDYVSEKPFLSFLGTDKISETINELLDYSMAFFQFELLKLIPEVVVKTIDRSEFNVLEDADSHDYILSVDYLMALDKLPRSGNYSGYWCQKFLKLYPNTKTKIDSLQNVDKAEVKGTFIHWSNSRQCNHWELNEFRAFDRFIDNHEIDNEIVSIYDSSTLIGFVTIEKVSEEFAITHFAKADVSYKGIYSALLWEVGKVLSEKKIRYLNFEQDLGIPGLRYSKKKFKPSFYLKKFIIERKSK